MMTQELQIKKLFKMTKPYREYNIFRSYDLDDKKYLGYFILPNRIPIPFNKEQYQRGTELYGYTLPRVKEYIDWMLDIGIS